MAWSGVCSSSTRLTDAKPAKIQTSRKQGFKKDLPKHFNHTTFSIKWKVLLFQNTFHVFIFSQEFCILLFGFCFFWFVSWRVGQNVAWMKLKSELLFGFMSSDLRLFAHFSSSPKKIVLKELSIILLTDP